MMWSEHFPDDFTIGSSSTTNLNAHIVDWQDIHATAVQGSQTLDGGVSDMEVLLTWDKNAKMR